MRASVFCACDTASPAIRAGLLHLAADLGHRGRPISLVAAATERTLSEASFEAVATMPESFCVFSAAPVSVPAASFEVGRRRTTRR